MIIYCSFQGVPGFVIIPNSSSEIPKKLDGLEVISIRDRVEDSVVVHKHSDLLAARQGKKPFWCWKVSEDGKSKKTDATQIYWALNQEEAIDYFCEKYEGDAIIIDQRCKEIYISKGKAKKRTLKQQSLFQELVNL